MHVLILLKAKEKGFFLDASVKNNNMKFNGSKFQVMRYGANEDIKNDTNYFTNDTSDIIDRYETLRDLGVILTDDASFSSHIEKVMKKVKKKLAGS